MLKAVVVLVLLLSVAGCSSHSCSDGSSGMGFSVGPVSASQSRYTPCSEECLDPVELRPCGCSRSCPCWRKHN